MREAFNKRAAALEEEEEESRVKVKRLSEGRTDPKERETSQDPGGPGINRRALKDGTRTHVWSSLGFRAELKDTTSPGRSK